MDQSDLPSVFKDLPNRILTVPIEDRPELFKRIADAISKPGLNPAIIKGLCRIVATTLTKYKDASSQKLVRELINTILKNYHDAAIQNFSSVIKTIIQKELASVLPQKTAKLAVIALGWVSLILSNSDKTSDGYKAELGRLMDYQSLLYQNALYHPNLNILEVTRKILLDVYGTASVAIEAFGVFLQKEPGFNVALFLCMLVGVLEESNDEIIQRHSSQLIDHFVKGIITTKVKPQKNHIVVCSVLLKRLTSKEFEEFLFPPIQRALLRNPEVLLEAVGLIVQELNIDINAFVQPLGMIVIKHLHSKDELTRIESAESLKQLAMKCSNVQVIETLLKEIFDVLHGRDGKITVAEYRINLLQGAANLSFNALPTNDDATLKDTVIKSFYKILENEIQEKVICTALDMFSFWVKSFTGEVAKDINELFKKNIDVKSNNGQIRLAYLHWYFAALSNAEVTKGTSIVSLLIPLFDKCGTTQQQSVAEGVCAACIILKMDPAIDDSSLGNFWSILLDVKQSFYSERFVLTASAETLCCESYITQRLLCQYFDKLKGPVERLYKILALCLTCNFSKVREFTLKLLPAILLSPKGVHFVENIISEFDLRLETLKLKQDNEININESGVPPAAMLAACLQNLCAFENLSIAESTKLAMQILLICHHPLLMNSSNDLWNRILKEQFHFDPNDFLSVNIEKYTTLIIENFKSTTSYKNVVSSTVSLNSAKVIPVIMNRIINDLKDVSAEISDEDYAIYIKSKEINGGVCHAENKQKSDNSEFNYRIEDKMHKEVSKTKPNKLSQKQLEALKNQSEKENIIKTRISNLSKRLQDLITLFEAALSGNSHEISLYFSTLLPLIIEGFKSPLAASSLINLFYSLRTICFQNENTAQLGELIAITSIRLNNPKCDLLEEWQVQRIDKAIIQTLQSLHELIKTTNTNNQEEVESLHLSAPSFAYVFQFLKSALTTECVSKHENYLLMGIDILTHYTQVDDPCYMPITEMLELILALIPNNLPHIQIKLTAVLIDLAKICSGDNVGTAAGEKQINVCLDALLSNLKIIRDIALRSLKIMFRPILRSLEANENLSKKAALRLWVAKHDESAECSALAIDLWEQLKLTPPEPEALLGDITDCDLSIQKAASIGLASLLEQNKQLLKKNINRIISIYKEKLVLIPPKLDKFDREIEPAIDQWRPRRGLAIAIAQIAQLFSIEDVNLVMQFMVSHGLGDNNESVQKEMLAASLKIVDQHGKEAIVDLLPVFQEFLDKAPKSEHYDNIRQAVVILMGSLARHLKLEDKRIEPIVQRLLAALYTPSQQVQEAVSNCLPHLIPSLKEEAPNIIKKLLHMLVKSEKYGERRGAAYGIAGVVKGLGILSLKQYDIMSKLTTYIQEKKNYKSREGALFAFELLCTTLGRLFEPYIVHVLPHLLQCFGDTSQYVRQAADDTARVVMGKLSAHGVKLILPSLLAALDEDSWRTKTASVELLGAMAFCAPKQLSSCLPNIVPKLIEVLGDSHAKVQEAGAEALKVIGSVIKNPEIQVVVPVLLRALEDPSKNTSLCLQSLLQTKFVHFIDAPSLALIMPVVQRAFMDRSTETRKMAAQIIGNMYSLTDQKDLTPYLPNIIPGLKMSLLDPVPDVRAVSARALGAMVRGMGESSFEDLLPWLMQTLTSETSSVDRSGAAQGLSEVVGGLGVEKLHKLMPEIISTSERNDIAPHVKDGYIMMFIYMPGVFPEEFTPYIGQIINPILKALADENEYVRDTALKAGQRLVNMYAETAVTLLLPELEKGLFDENWRIRFSSVQLLGDLLYRISGVSGKMTTETASEDDNFGTEQSHKAIIYFLGVERRNRVLSGLYMGRSDVSLMVRQAALHIWKVVVTNTPRTLKEILPTLFSLLLGCLASTSYDKRQVAARTLGDLVRKLGERVLPEIIPILEQGLTSVESDQRQGVCIGLSEIMASTSKEMVLTFVDSLVPTVRKALSDPLPEVREAAAKTFESLHSTVGSRALDDILPVMLQQLSDKDTLIAENTLDGLRQIMLIKSRVVLPYLVPHLTAPPINTKALSTLLSVAGDALTKYLPKILSALLQALSDAHGTPREHEELEHCRIVVLSISDEVGVRTVMDVLMTSAKSTNLPTRKSAISLLSAFCICSPGDYSQFVPQLLRCLLRLMVESDREILQMSWDGLNAVIKTLNSAQQIAHVNDVRQAVRFATSDLTEPELPGFCLPKGITPLIPVFREAILNGLPDEKENAAQGLGEIILLTNAQALQSSVVHITGPLIRILGDRFNANVKAAVLETLAILLYKVGIMLKQFLPQLQTTFLKALYDQNRIVRLKAGHALSRLVVIHSRADPLFNDVYNNIKNSDDMAVRETMLHALRKIITPAGNKISEPLLKQIYVYLLTLQGHNEDNIRSIGAGCLGALLKYITSEMLDEYVKTNFIQEKDDGPLKHGRSVVLFVALKENPNILMQENYEETTIKFMISCISSDKVNTNCNGIRAAAYMMQYCLSNKHNVKPQVITAFARSMNQSNNEVKQLVAKSCIHLGKTLTADQISPDVIKFIVPALVNGTKEKNTYVRVNCEIALLTILRLQENETIYLQICDILDSGARESFNDVVSKVLRKVENQSVEKEELDYTILI